MPGCDSCVAGSGVGSLPFQKRKSFMGKTKRELKDILRTQEEQKKKPNGVWSTSWLSLWLVYGDFLISLVAIDLSFLHTCHSCYDPTGLFLLLIACGGEWWWCTTGLQCSRLDKLGYSRARMVLRPPWCVTRYRCLLCPFLSLNLRKESVCGF